LSMSRAHEAQKPQDQRQEAQFRTRSSPLLRRERTKVRVEIIKTPIGTHSFTNLYATSMLTSRRFWSCQSSGAKT
jgi:hypothetical protein